MYNDNDYRDYLQHEGRAHKYILKIGKGAQARYFYTQQEIEAFRNKATKKVKGMANDAGAAVDVAKEKSRKIALSAKNKAKTIEKDTRPTRKKIAKTVKREAKELRRDAKRKWDTSLPARKMRTAKAKRLKEIEKSNAYREKVADMNQGRIAPSTRTRYGHSIINNRNNKNLSERNREKLNQLYQKETSESEKKSKKKLQRSVKRDQLKKKAKGAIKNSKKRAKEKINESIDKSNRKYTTNQIDYNKKNTYHVNGKSVGLNTFIKEQRNSDGSYRTLEYGNNKNHYISTNKSSTNKSSAAKQREKAWKKRNKEVVKASKKQKRTERKRKVKKIVNSVLRRG